MEGGHGAYDLAGLEPRKPERLHSSLFVPRAWAQSAPPADTAENVERGKAIYVKRCLVCHGEKGLMMSLSSWVFVTVEAPVPLTARLSSLLAVVLVGLVEWWLIRRVRRE